MRPMGLKRNYIVGILDDRQSIFNQDYANQFKELTEFFTRFKYFGKVIHGKTINEILDKALQEDKEYCIIQCVGHFIKEISFFELIEKWIEKRNFFITGHIIDKETINMQSKGNGYYGLHKQCLLVNLKYYIQLNKPEYGNKNKKNVKVIKANRHIKDIHDDYTPLSLNPTEETVVCTPIVDGWNFINKSLEKGLTVYNFHPKIRESKSYAYPNKSLQELQEQLSWINQILSHAPKCVFFWNTEKYIDIDRNKKLLKGKPIKKLYSVAASFKPNYFLETYGFTENTEIIFYDYSKQALAFKAMMLIKWNGKDYPQFLYDIQDKYHINETTHNPYGSDDYEKLWKKECEQWGGEENITRHWEKYRKLKHSYIYCDIAKNSNKIINKITKEENSIIWWSNCFHTVNTHYTRKLNEVEELYINWLKNINKKNPNLWVFGKDYLNRPVEGNTIESILKENKNVI